MKVITVTKAKYISEYQVSLEFDDGLSGVVDLEKYIDGIIFLPLRDKEYFKNFSLGTWTIGWDNGADFSPEFLYELAKESTIESTIVNT